jgi:acyl-CoA thioester hydrolase
VTTAPDPRTLARSDFDVLWPVTTRWADNDMFGHLNNAVYYQLFDTAINGWIEQELGIDPMTTAIRAVVVQSSCRYFSEVHFPQPLTVAFRAARLGRTSVTYDVALFAADGPLAAFGEWVHVYVDHVTGRPVPIPDNVRALTDRQRG